MSDPKFTGGLPPSGKFAREPRSLAVTYTAPPGGVRELKCGFVVDITTQATGQAFEWASLFAMNNFANQGENVACYGKGFKYGRGPTWAACFEAKDLTGGNIGALYGVEIDVWANGPGTRNRFGIGFNFGNATGGARPTIDFGIDMSPSMGDRGAAALGVGMNCNIDCDDALVKMANGAQTPAILDIAEAGPIGAVLELSSANPVFSSSKPGRYIGKLKIRIDGHDFAVPVHAWK
ncbi:hypothetical protein J5J83_19715 [Azoarcus sp. L1K30]|uniref:hypothetical protein n=1 Tax=Azoarcus sp. L1K30 TaxID=2820277 RepID=UPI001B83DFB7|nr:hypothetical protein [Azoarcus sp. L1K30]MBR0568355.1 hypothetical protein [Azoarcus sp. L1K30]